MEDEADSSQDIDLSLIQLKGVQVAFYLVYSVIFILGLLGNALVCFVVFRNKLMQTVTNLFITNLALSDILLCVLAVPFTPLYTFLEKWIFGSLICHLVPFAQCSSVYISALTLTAIAIDRFILISNPLEARMKTSVCLTIILIIWLFSMLITLPYGIYIKHTTTANGTHLCEENWPSLQSRIIFGTFTTVMQFIFPFLIMAFCYFCFSQKLRIRIKLKPGNPSARKRQADKERQLRTNLMLIAMVVVFLISWLPLNLINIINDFNYRFITWKYYFISFFLTHALAMSSVCYNPLLYAWLNDNFRKEFKAVLPCFNIEKKVKEKKKRVHESLIESEERKGTEKTEFTYDGCLSLGGREKRNDSNTDVELAMLKTT